MSTETDPREVLRYTDRTNSTPDDHTYQTVPIIRPDPEDL